MSFRRRSALLCVGLVLAVTVAYLNHFHNGFHFDDSHTILSNTFIRDLRNVPRFFTDGTLFSSKPEARTWRPLTSASLAIDHWIAGGLKPFYFQLSTFVWFAVQLILMFFLYQRLMDAAEEHPSNLWTAMLAAACYGLHPVNADTVNYVIQRGEIYSTLGVVASQLWFAARPEQRKRGWYLLPAIAAFLAKAPALIFPLILLAYVFLFEQDARVNRWRAALRAALPVLLAGMAAAILTALMTPATYVSGAESAALYRATQPWVALHYFKSFFLPFGLSADRGWNHLAGPLSGKAMAGYGFVALLVVAAFLAARRRDTRPISFGILWFLLAMLPTSLMPLADITNDHRIFFPFVGLTLAVAWSLRWLLFRLAAAGNRFWLPAGVAAAAALLVLAAVGTRQRNRVWRTEESLWRDVTLKSPRNPRGWINYAASLMGRGAYRDSVPCLERARALAPGDYVPELNLGVAYSHLRHDADADRHFAKAVALAPDDSEPYLYYGRWLLSRGRKVAAQAQLEAAVRADRFDFDARHLLMQIYSERRQWRALDALAEETLRLAPGDATAARYRAERAKRRHGPSPSRPTKRPIRSVG